MSQSNRSYAAPTPEQIARGFHEAYEAFAPDFGYATRKESAVPWEEVPEANRALMIATVRNVLIEQHNLLQIVNRASRVVVAAQLLVGQPYVDGTFLYAEIAALDAELRGNKTQ